MLLDRERTLNAAPGHCANHNRCANNGTSVVEPVVGVWLVAGGSRGGGGESFSPLPTNKPINRVCAKYESGVCSVAEAHTRNANNLVVASQCSAG